MRLPLVGHQQSSPHFVRIIALVGGFALVWLVLAQAAWAAGISVDASVQTHQSAASSTISAGPLTTTSANDLLVAFITSDGPNSSGGQSFSSVTGGGLTWKLRKRTNSRPGTSEIWEAAAPSALSNVTITATRSSGSYGGSMVVVAFAGADTTVDGAVGSGNAASGPQTASLTTTRAGSWVWGVGNDWDNAVLERWAAAKRSSTSTWRAPAIHSGSKARRLPAVPPTRRSRSTTLLRPPTAGICRRSRYSRAPRTRSVRPRPRMWPRARRIRTRCLSTWTASTDNVGVAGYTILRNGSPIGSAAGTSYTDTTVSPSTTYSYTVEAFRRRWERVRSIEHRVRDDAGCVDQSAGDLGCGSTDISQTSATINWTTDIPSSSQVLYGTTTRYGQSTSLSQRAGHEPLADDHRA